MTRLNVVRGAAIVAGILFAVNIDFDGSMFGALAPIGVFVCFCIFALSKHIAAYRKDPKQFSEHVQKERELANNRDTPSPFE